jgi:ABC-2 type transport system ATP-binding protein
VRLAIRTEGLTKRFGAVLAVDALDLEVRRGEVFGYLGPNGAGKTTTIRLLLDFLRPTSGSAQVLDGTGADPAVRARIGYLPGDLHLDPRYTAGEVIEFYGALRGPGGRRLAGSLLERFDLDPTRPIGELSTGNRRKVGIVQAFMHEPELLVLDEPTSGLDPLLQHQFQLLVGDAVAGGATVFLSSHVLPEVEALADRVAILRRGRLVTVAGIDELRSQARQRIELHIPDGDPAAFEGVPGVTEVTGLDGVIRLVVEGSVDAVLKTACRFDVRRIVTHEADLEDVFLDFYGQGDG